MILKIVKKVKNVITNQMLNKRFSLKFNAQIVDNIMGEFPNGSMKIGSKSRLTGNKVIGNISIGSHTWITDSTITSCQKSSVEIGNYTLMQDHTQAIAVHKNITIGNFCTIGLGSALASFAHCYYNYTSSYLDKRLKINKATRNSYSQGEIRIGHDCLIGRRSYIGPGVILGNGCIVLPNSVVTTSFEPYSIIAGVPAKKIGKRFSNRKIEYLTELNWYEWEHEKIVNNIDLLLSVVGINKEFVEA